jgi:Alcohol dehydrogenase GroES-associated
MRAVCWEGKETIRVETVPDPVILVPRQTRLVHQGRDESRGHH